MFYVTSQKTDKFGLPPYVLCNSACVICQRITDMEDLQCSNVQTLPNLFNLSHLTIVLYVSEVSVGLTLAAEGVHVGRGEDGVRACREAGNLVLRPDLLQGGEQTEGGQAGEVPHAVLLKHVEVTSLGLGLWATHQIVLMLVRTDCDHWRWPHHTPSYTAPLLLSHLTLSQHRGSPGYQRKDKHFLINISCRSCRTFYSLLGEGPSSSPLLPSSSNPLSFWRNW